MPATDQLSQLKNRARIGDRDLRYQREVMEEMNGNKPKGICLK